MTATDPQTVVSKSLKAWETLDIDTIMEYFADDAVYENVPLQPATGHDAVRDFIKGILLYFKEVDVDILNQVSDGGTVLNERTDTITLTNGKVVPLRVMGIFEIRDGKIVRWSDYFDGDALENAFKPE